MKKPSILIIYTGGTIGMINDAETGMLKPFDFEQMQHQIPSLRKFGYHLNTISFEKPIDSSDMNPSVWVQLAKIIASKNEQYDGFVVLHGTDTMSYSASALSFMLEHLQKPVIFTGSQLPLETLRTDGKENIITAIEIAAAKKRGKPVVPEVCIYFENKLFRGNRTRKYNAEHFAAFESPNYPPLAKVGVHIVYNFKAIHYPRLKKIFKAHITLDTNIAILKIFPGISPSVVEGLLNSKGLRAVVLETYGAGNAPNAQWFVNLLKAAMDKSIIIINITQCNAGTVEMGRYETSVQLKNLGIVSGNDMTTEATIGKLMFLLGQKLSYSEIKQYMVTSIAGELTAEGH